MPVLQSIGIGQVSANFKTKYISIESANLVKSGIGASLVTTAQIYIMPVKLIVRTHFVRSYKVANYT